MILSRRKKIHTAIPSHSLADIAFLLLIFFLVSTTFVTERTLNLSLPAMGSSRPVPIEQIIRIELDAQGARRWLGLRLSREELVQRAATAVRETPEKIFYVMVSPRAAYSDYIRLLDDLRKARVTRIAIHDQPQP